MHDMARRRDLHPALERVGPPTDLAEAPTDLADAASDESRDKALRAETQEAADRCGGGVGTPILSFAPPGQDGERGGPALLGPMIDAVPSGDEALRLWDAVVTLAQWRGFAELKPSVRSFPDTPLSANLARTDTQVR